MRIGHGYDVHKLVENRKLILGGVHIPYEKGLLGHSDADVLAHAIADALLGAATLGDIGVLFPDDDPQYAGADSLKLLAVAVAAVRRKGFGIENIDATVLAQRPKLRPYIDEMRRNIASACNLDLDCVSIKATTEEGLGFTGRGEGIAAHAVCLLNKFAVFLRASLRRGSFLHQFPACLIFCFDETVLKAWRCLQWKTKETRAGSGLLLSAA